VGGGELDGTTGLYYVRARWYDPFLGRFVSEDPIGIAGGINLYGYALNDPVNRRDPSGLCPGYWDGNGFVVQSRYGGCGWRGSLDIPDYYDPNMWNDDGFSFYRDPECERVIPGNKFSACKTDLVPEEDWENVRLRIESIQVGAPECAGAKNALLDLWNQGRAAGGIQFWVGRDFQYNPDGSPRYLRPGWRATVFGNHDGDRVLFEGAEFWINPTLPVHEGLHRWLYVTGDPRGLDAHPFIESIESRCPATFER